MCCIWNNYLLRRIPYGMSAEFFRKKWLFILSCATALFIVAGIYAYTRYLDKATVEAVSQNYYFLVAESTHVEASTHQIILSGGAGYLLDTGDREYVTVASYLTNSEAENVQKSLTEDTKIISLKLNNLYFKTRKQKRNAKKIKAAFLCFADCIEVLYQEISRLEKGGTQESCKRILETLKKQIDYLAKEYKDVFVSYGNLCDKTVKELDVLIQNTVFVSDLRRLQCDMCYSLVRLQEEYSL